LCICDLVLTVSVALLSLCPIYRLISFLLLYDMIRTSALGFISRLARTIGVGFTRNVARTRNLGSTPDMARTPGLVCTSLLARIYLLGSTPGHGSHYFSQGTHPQ